MQHPVPSPVPVAFWCPDPDRSALDGLVAVLARQVRGGIAPLVEDEAGLADSLPAVLGAGAGPHCVVFWAGFEDHLAALLPGSRDARGGSDAVPQDAPTVALALAAWERRARAMLNAFASARRRVTLVPAAALAGSPGVLADALATVLGARAAAATSGPIGESPVDPGDAVILPPGRSAQAGLMAAAVLQTAPAAQRLLDEIEAASLPVPGLSLRGAQTAAGLAALLEAGAAREEARHRAALSLAVAEAQFATRVELESSAETTLRHERAVRDHAEAERVLLAEAMIAQDEALARHRAEAAALTARLARQEAEARAVQDRTAADLAEARTALASAVAARDEATETARRLQERLVQGEAQVASQTAALQAAGVGAEARAAALAEVQAALAEARIRLEAALAGREGLEEQTRAQEAELVVLGAEARQRAEVIRRQRAELVEEAARRAAAEAERAALLGSTSWRVTAPLRSIVLTLRRLKGTR